VSTPNNPSGNTGGQQPSSTTGQTSAQAGGSIRERLQAPVSNPDANSGGDSRRSDISSGDFQQTDSREQLRANGRDERQRSGGQTPEPVEVQEPRATDVSAKAAKAAERKVAALFLLSLVGVVGFILWYSLAEFEFGEPNNVYFTPVLGLFMTLALVGVGAGAVMWAKLLMPDEEAVQERHAFASAPEDKEATGKALKQGFEQTGLQRRPLLITTLLLGAGSLALMPIPFLFALGPTKSKEKVLGTTPWTRGMRLVRENGTYVRLGDLQIGGVESVFPDLEGGTHLPDTPTLLIRMRPEQLELEGQAQEWAYQGHVAYSSICTHLGCPVKLYEAQSHNLLCPCHQSTFNAAQGARVIFGPAARPLPQLPIGVDEDGYFVALQDFPEPVGPSYWERDT
jgi:ubiquinol-cytochrome c reductase iron-sulfur subunit